MRKLPHTRSCFVCGQFNPIGIKLDLETDGRIVRAIWVPRAEHVGLKQTVHGGIISTILDEMMAWACAVHTRRFAFCAELTVRFIQPVRPAEQILATGELIDNRRNKIFITKAELQNPSGTIMASATGKYLPVKETEASEMATDLLGDPSSVTGS